VFCVDFAESLLCDQSLLKTILSASQLLCLCWGRSERVERREEKRREEKRREEKRREEKRMKRKKRKKR
jgi:hypothetical protein